MLLNTNKVVTFTLKLIKNTCSVVPIGPFNGAIPLRNTVSLSKVQNKLINFHLK